MPRWKPEGESPAFDGDRRLTNEQIALLVRWLKAGAPEGGRDDLPPPPAAIGGWLWGEPDLVLALPTYALRADGADVFRNFVVTVHGKRTRYVRGLQFRPRSRGVHHANIRIDPTPASRALDDADPAPGYEGVILHFFFQAEDGIRDLTVTGVQTCALPICRQRHGSVTVEADVIRTSHRSRHHAGRSGGLRRRERGRSCASGRVPGRTVGIGAR